MAEVLLAVLSGAVLIALLFFIIAILHLMKNSDLIWGSIRLPFAFLDPRKRVVVGILVFVQWLALFIALMILIIRLTPSPTPTPCPVEPTPTARTETLTPGTPPVSTEPPEVVSPTATLTESPAPTFTPTSTPTPQVLYPLAAGELIRKDCGDWPSCRSTIAGNDNRVGAQEGSVGASVSNFDFAISRLFLVFDVSHVDASLVVDHATLHLRVARLNATARQARVHVVCSTARYPPLIEGSFGEMSWDSKGNAMVSPVGPAGEWLAIDLEADVACIRDGGYLKLAVLHERDYGNVVPGDISDVIFSLGSPYRPYIDVYFEESGQAP